MVQLTDDQSGEGQNFRKNTTSGTGGRWFWMFFGLNFKMILMRKFPLEIQRSLNVVISCVEKRTKVRKTLLCTVKLTDSKPAFLGHLGRMDPRFQTPSMVSGIRFIEFRIERYIGFGIAIIQQASTSHIFDQSPPFHRLRIWSKFVLQEANLNPRTWMVHSNLGK